MVPTAAVEWTIPFSISSVLSLSTLTVTSFSRYLRNGQSFLKVENVSVVQSEMSVISELLEPFFFIRLLKDISVYMQGKRKGPQKVRFH